MTVDATKLETDSNKRRDLNTQKTTEANHVRASIRKEYIRGSKPRHREETEDTRSQTIQSDRNKFPQRRKGERQTGTKREERYFREIERQTQCMNAEHTQQHSFARCGFSYEINERIHARREQQRKQRNRNAGRELESSPSSEDAGRSEPVEM